MLREFKSKKEAFNWMEERCVELDGGDNFTDNFRFANKNNPKSVQKYNRIASSGCCGFFDETVIVRGRKALIGCNYGH